MFTAALPGLLTSSLCVALAPPRVLRTLPRCRPLCTAGDAASVSGTVYRADPSRPTVRLFTKAGCTLCDVAKAVLVQAAEERPHTLEAVDITDADNADWHARYKYDIPVLHIGEAYWAKHRCGLHAPPRPPLPPPRAETPPRVPRRRIELDDTLAALAAAEAGSFEAQRGEPDAERLEKRRVGPLRRDSA